MPEIAFFMRNLDGGGAERAIVALAGEIAKRGHGVDLVVGDARSDYRFEVSSAIQLHDFRAKSPLLVFIRLVAYLRHRNPIVVMSALDVANIMLVVAAKLAAYKGKIVVSQRAVIAASQRELTPARRMFTSFLQRVCFRRAHAVISNSRAAANEIPAVLGVPAEKVVTIHNAVDIDRIRGLASEPLGNHAFLQDQAALIVSVGSLTKRKDMATLIKAFANVRAQRRAHLVVIGKGPEEAAIESLISDLRLDGSVHLLGFDANPYKWMAAAAVFVSSSTGEGFPNVVAEALALGRSIVATDCPGDTAELLERGKWGRLVPVGNSQRMADGILAALDDPRPADGRIRAADFSPANIGTAYLKVLHPRSGGEVCGMPQSS